MISDDAVGKFLEKDGLTGFRGNSNYALRETKLALLRRNMEQNPALRRPKMGVD